jgi:hypothetical protein
MPRSIERARLVELEAEGEQMTAMAENSRKPWTAEEDERLRQLVVSGASVGEIAEKLDRTEPAAEASAYFLRVTLGRFGAKRRGISRWG